MRIVRWLIAIAIIAVVCWQFPLFHVVRLKTAKSGRAAAFSATDFAEAFWKNKLLPSVDKAVNAGMLITAIQSDPAAAKKKFSRSVGLGDSYFYFVAGTGRVMAVSEDAISLVITDKGTNAQVALQDGLIFGNALRDGTGLLDASAYPNSQDFNDISAALNHIVETRVLPGLREQAKIGAMISFAGCAEVDDESSDLKPLKVVLIQTKSQ